MKKMNTLVAVLALVLASSACGGLPSLIGQPVGGGTVPPMPTTAHYPQTGTTRPALLIQFCNDNTGSYPREYFHGASTLIANSLVGAVTSNEQGVTLFATAITHNTFDPSNTLSPAFQIRDIPAYGPTPTLIPTAAPRDPFTDPPTQTAIATANVNGIITYNATVEANYQLVQSVKASIAQTVGRLKTWNPPVDDVGTSVLGCFQLAASRLAGKPAVKKMIYIASDLENNSDVDKTQNFVKAHSLEGVVVHVIYFYSQDANRNNEKAHNWCTYLKSAGASIVTFSDPVASTTLTSDMFDQDLAATPSPCP